jgi:hypothetical protein
MTASMFTLGDMYERGGAVLKDPAAAFAWFAIANELERQANKGAETPLARNAQARGEAMALTISGADRERAEKIGQEELRQIVAALAPKPALAPSRRAASDACRCCAAAAPAAPPSGEPADRPTQPAWPTATADQVKAVQQALIDQHRCAARPTVRPDRRRARRSATSRRAPACPRPASRRARSMRADQGARTREEPPAPSDAWPTNGADQIRAIQKLLAELKLLNAEPTGTVGRRPAARSATISARPASRRPASRAKRCSNR